MIIVLLNPSEIKAQSLSLNDIKTQLVKDWQRAKAYTINYLNAMPPDKYSFKAVDSIRSFAQQMLHLAWVNFYIMANASDQKPPAFIMGNLEHRSGAQTKDSVMYYVTTSYDYCINAVNAFDLTKWGEIKEVFGYKETKFALMLKAFEHQTHSRGQTTIYIRLQGIRPPAGNLF
ncbi:MAG: damage-inducible protein DinB [Flavisolibacter sp.]|nr:damage-inducible protein DinB [Flavisolibacter sp.]